MKKKLIHIVFLLTECALFSGLMAWFFFADRPYADAVYLSSPSTLTVCFEDGQEKLLNEIAYLRVYYTSKKDSEWSDRQTYLVRDFRPEPQILCGKLPAGALNFRIDVHYKTGKSKVLPKVKEVWIAKQVISGVKLKEFYFEHLGFSGYQYAPKIILNGYFPHFILFAAVGWIVMAVVIGLCLRKSCTL